MNMSQEEFNGKIYDVIRDKVFLSNISGMPVTVVKELPEQIKPGKVLFDGTMLFDGIEGIEDDIQQMTSFTKDKVMVNVEDYYTENGAFEDDGMDRFIASLERLMTVKEFLKFLKLENKADRVGLEEDQDPPVNAELLKRFASAEEEGWDAVNEVYGACLEESVERQDRLSEEEIATVLRLRAEKWRGVNEELSEDYERLLGILHEEYELLEWRKDKVDENGHAVIPDGTTEIVGRAFEACTDLVGVEIPSRVRVICYGAFYACTGLTKVVIPEGVEEIQECAFKGCAALADVSLPESLKRVSSDAFVECTCEVVVMTECEAKSIIY